MIMFKRLFLVAIVLLAHLSVRGMKAPERFLFPPKLYPESDFDLTPSSRESRERSDQLCRLEPKFKAINNWHDPIPNDNAPLDEKYITTPFWNDMKKRSQAEKDAALKKHVLEEHFGTASWYLQRYHIAAAVAIAGANPNTRGDLLGWVPLNNALSHQDEPLTNLLLSHGADPKLPHSMTGSTLGAPLIFSAKTVALATALIKHGATIDVTDRLGRTVLHKAAISRNAESELIPYYVSLAGESLLKERITFDRRAFYEGDTLYQLTALEYYTQNFLILDVASGYKSLKNRLDAFKKAGVTDADILAAAEKLREKRDSFLLTSRDEYDHYTKRIVALKMYIE